MEQNPNYLYEFGGFRLDVAERLLQRAGQGVSLTPKAFELLVALIDQPGRLLEREALMKTVWPDTFVEDNNLADNISRLRKALGEGENGQRFIETVPRRGYRFVAEVKRQESARAESVLEKPELLAAVPPSGRNRLNGKLTSALIVICALVGSGIWLSLRAKKRAEIDRLEFRGNFYISRWNEDDVRTGIELYKRATALDPNSASSYQGLAIGWSFLSDLHVSPRDAMPKSKEAALKALQLDERSAPAHITLAVIKTQYEWDWVGAEQEFKRALALDPQHRPAHQLYAWYLIAAGRPEEAQAKMTYMVDTGPQDDFSLWGLGLSYYFARQYGQAIEQYRRAIGVEPKSHWPHMLLGWAYDQQGKFAEALAELNQASRLFDNNPQILAAIGHTYARSGDRAAAEKVISDLRETAKHRYVSPYDMATIYAGLGEKDQAMEWLERAYEDRSGWLAWWLDSDPKFDSLRSDSRFKDLLARIGFPSAAMRR